MNEGPIWDGLTGSKNDLRRAEGRKTTPDATDFDAIVRETIETQKGVARCGEAIRDLQARVNEVPDSDDVAALADGVIDAQEKLAKVAGDVVKASSDQKTELLGAVAQYQELLDGFNSVDDLRYWAEQARRFRHGLAELMHKDPDELRFPSESERLKGWSQEQRQGYERGKDAGYRAGYARGYSEASKGLPCRLNLPNLL